MEEILKIKEERWPIDLNKSNKQQSKEACSNYCPQLSKLLKKVKKVKDQDLGAGFTYRSAKYLKKREEKPRFNCD